MQPSPRPTFHAALSAALSSDPNRLLERAMQLQALDRRLRLCLPEPLASHVSLGNLRGGKLVFLADAPVWKARLRLHADALLDAARAAGIPADDIAVKVATMLPAPPDAAPHKPLSSSARETLRAAASAMRDEDLKSRLLQLASLAENDLPGE